MTSQTTWTGAALDGDVSNASNWTNGVIQSGYDIIIDSSPVDISAGLTTYSAVNINSLNVTPRFRMKLGTATTPLTVGNIAASANLSGNGPWTKVSAGSVPKARIFVPSAGSVYIAAGTWYDVECFGAGGYVEVDPAAIVGNGGGAAIWRHNGPKLYIPSTSNGTSGVVGTLSLDGGLVTCLRNANTIKAYGAGSRFIMQGTAAIVTGGEIAAGGVLNYQSSGGLSPTNAIELRKGGTITPAGNANTSIQDSSLAGTAFALKVNQWPGSVLVLRDGTFAFNQSNVVPIGPSPATGASSSGAGAIGTVGGGTSGA